MAALNPRLADLSGDDRQVPQKFGRYRIIKRLGQGGMGSVYLAQDTHLERSVALKVPDLGNDEDPEARRRFLEEARIAATLRHPYLCPVYDAGEIDGQPYLTMAYIEGQSLAALIGDEGWPQRQVAALVGKLALALQEAHSHTVIHRDLKPANVMIKTTGQRREPVIVDFGLAHRDNRQEQRLTKSGQIMGTLGYMAPEQIRGDLNEIGPACDIYALGVILYELLTGRLPFSGSGLAVAGKILTQTPLPPSTYRSDLDPALEAICLKAMAKAVGDRYASMAELAAALTGFIHSLAASAPPTASDAPPDSLSRISDKCPQPPGSDSLVLQLLGQLGEREASPSSVITQGPDVSRTPLPERLRPPLPLTVAAVVLGVLAFGMILNLRDRGTTPSTVNSKAPSPGGRLANSGGDDQSTQFRRPRESRVPVEIAPKTAEAQVKVTVKSPAQTTADKPSSPPATMRTEKMERLALPSTRFIYADEFENNRSGLIKDLNTPPKPNPGKSDGVFYFYAPRGGPWRGWDMRRFDSDSTCEVVGRVSGDDPRKNGAWSVLVLNTSGLGRGMRVKINIKGELFVEPNPWPAGSDFLRVDPRMGPIAHPAIKPGSEYNDLLLIVRKREVVIVVNGVQVCDPVKLEYDITPSKLQLGVCGPGNKWAEFDRLEIREIMQSKDKPGRPGGTPVSS